MGSADVLVAGFEVWDLDGRVEGGGGDFYKSREWSPSSLRSLVDHKKIGFRSLGAPRLG